MARVTILGFIFMTALCASAQAQQETLVMRADGAPVTVRTDESGTTVDSEKKGFAGEPISPQEEAHWAKVYELTKEGGRVVAHRPAPTAR